MSITIRLAAPDDVHACAALDALAWGPADGAPEDRLLARILANPYANLVALDGGRVVGSIWTVSSAERLIQTWRQAIGAAGNAAELNPFGELVVGVNIAVHPDWLAHGLAARLIERSAALAFAAGKRRLALFPPMAGYAQWQRHFAPGDYVRLMQHEGTLYFQAEHGGVTSIPLSAVFDPAVKLDPRSWPAVELIPDGAALFDAALEWIASARVGGRRGRVVAPLALYFRNAASCDYGVRIEWMNPELG